MTVFAKKLFLVCVLAVAGFGLVSCSGGNAIEDKFAAIVSEINPTWELYEIQEKGEGKLIKIECSDVVPLDEAKKTVKAFQEVEPELKGMVEWYNSEVGMTLRKVEVFPGAI